MHIRDFGNTILELRTQAGLSQNELAERLCALGLSISNQHIYKWEKNINRPNAIQFIALCRILNIDNVVSAFSDEGTSEYWKLNDEGRKKADDFIHILNESGLFARRSFESPASDIFLKRLPVYLQPVSAGTGQFLDGSDFIEMEVPASTASNADFGVRISGNSMEPLYVDKQIVWIHRQSVINSEEIGIFLLNGDAYIKQYHIGTDGISLISLNPDYDPIEISGEDSLITYGKVLN